MKFCQCGQMYDLTDNIDARVLNYTCSGCQSSIPFEGNLVYSKKINDVKNKWNCYDITLPLSDKKCFKCDSNVIFKKQRDLTLLFYCIQCHESWS